MFKEYDELLSNYPHVQAEILADSISPDGIRLISFQVECPRFIWAEVMSHCMLARNASSSRAIPVDSMLKVNEEPVQPVFYGENKPGMSAHAILSEEATEACKGQWLELAKISAEITQNLKDNALHKQWANRPMEAFGKIRAVITCTEEVLQHFLWLRDDPECAQPEIVALARKMRYAAQQSTPFALKAGELHTPFVKRLRYADGSIAYYDADGNRILPDAAADISVSCCAQVSYRKSDASLSKADTVHARLTEGKPHGSPFEHVGICLENAKASWVERLFPCLLEDSVSHISRDGFKYGAKFKGWGMYRKILEKGWGKE